jgi:hypothetical protein
MQYGFQLARHSKRTASKIDRYWTTRGLAWLLEVDPDRIYRRLRKGIIDPSYVHFDEGLISTLSRITRVSLKPCGNLW